MIVIVWCAMVPILSIHTWCEKDHFVVLFLVYWLIQFTSMPPLVFDSHRLPFTPLCVCEWVDYRLSTLQSTCQMATDRCYWRLFNRYSISTIDHYLNRHVIEGLPLVWWSYHTYIHSFLHSFLHLFIRSFTK